MSGPGKPARRPPWNKRKLIGAKPPLRQGHVWSVRTRLQLERRTRDLALFNLAIDSKLRGCDVVAVRVDDVAPNGYAVDRATVRQKKTGIWKTKKDQLLHLLISYVQVAYRGGHVSFVGGKRLCWVYDITTLTQRETQIASRSGTFAKYLSIGRPR
jgi:hypothetical protein